MPSGTIGSSTGANNVTGVAADYTSIANWEAAIDGNNQTGTVIYIAAATDTSTVTLNAAYTGMLLTAHADAMVNAPTYAAATGRARVTAAINVSGSGWTIEKLGFDTAVTALNFSASATFRRSMIVGAGGGNGQVHAANTAITVTVSNVGLSLGSSGNVGFYAESAATMNLYHCSGYGSGSFCIFYREGTMSANACVAQGAATNFNSGWTGDYNVSQDATAPGSASTKYARSETGWFTDTTSTTEDLSLVAGKQGWWAANKDAIDQTGWPGDVATDIVGTSRAAPIDPGVWQTPAAGGGTTRGMPFGTRSTAFNGGRTFAGVIR